MYDDRGESAPIDSYDLYAMGLRPARCNGCSYTKLKHELGDKFLVLNDGMVSVFEFDAEPTKGQGKPLEHNGRSIRWRGSFMSIGHSDECWNWKPPVSKE